MTLFLGGGAVLIFLGLICHFCRAYTNEERFKTRLVEWISVSWVINCTARINCFMHGTLSQVPNLILIALNFFAIYKSRKVLMSIFNFDTSFLLFADMSDRVLR